MIIVIGKSGQLAQELNATKRDKEVIFLGRDEVDVFNKLKFTNVLNKYQPTVVINASAYTAVDKAESDAENAFALNRDAVKTIAIYCKQINCLLVHISTDFVFDGKSSEPYKVNDIPNPLNVYGLSKLAGEKAIQNIMNQNYIIIRTSWLYSSFGNNFVKTMLRVMNEIDEVSIINDQIGSPTYARGLAEHIWSLIDLDNPALIHHYSDAGQATWYEFACEIYRLGKLNGVIDRDVKIKPVNTASYCSPAKRPRFSVLENKNNIDWRVNLNEFIKKEHI